LNKQLFLFTFL